MAGYVPGSRPVPASSSAAPLACLSSHSVRRCAGGRAHRAAVAWSRLLPALLLVPVLAFAQANPPSTGYRTPVPELQAIVDAPRWPQLTLGPKRDIAAMVRTPELPSIATVAEPELKLAGLRINPRTYAPSRFSFGSDLWLMDVNTGAERKIEGLPQPLSIAGIAWSPDQRWIAVNQQEPSTGVNTVWLVDVGAAKARRLLDRPLNSVRIGLTWMPDSRHLLLGLRTGQGGPPQPSPVPAGPAMQETRGGGTVRQLRTYQDMLRNEDDARTLEHYLRVQPALVGVDGTLREIGKPDLYVDLSPSPDGKHLLAQRLRRPFSYVVPWSFFPRTAEVLALDGKRLHTVAELPLFEGLPSGNDAVTTGPRRIDWRSDAPATLVWAEAQDGGDPSKDTAVRDHVLMQAAPFDAAPQVLAKLGYRYAGATWGRGDLAMVAEYWWKTRQLRSWRVAPDAPQTAAKLLFEGSTQDRYNSPGDVVLTPGADGFRRMLIAPDGDSVYFIGDGASPEGDRPFLDRWNLATGEKTRLFRSEAPTYSEVAAVLDPAASQLLITRQSPTEPLNYYRVDLAAVDGASRALTAFPHPTPQLKDVKKEQIRYTRKDGVELTADLYLPPGFTPGRDAPLPLLMWAYPAEFKSASDASQVSGSPYRFNFVSFWGPLPFLARGYAVLDDPTMPIVGEGDAEPNDTYLPQLISSAEAAVDEVVRRGVADRERIAIGGHSYGAFMTANLLAHTRLYKAGIARSGAYNRTLTPFGFQAEERNYWAAQDTYLKMSPFNYADRIQDALLLIHGEEDNNSGTFPIQSERMFAAVKGLGGTARLVMLPKESHGYRARESILHMLAETDAWLEEFVKNAAPAAAQGEASAAASPTVERAGRPRRAAGG